MSYNWQNVLVSPTSTLREALSVLDSEALRIALVVDRDLHLVGVLTDGDIRRGLLKNFSLDSPVSTIMNIKPLTLAAGTPRKESVRLMQQKGLLAIPLVDSGKVVGLETLQKIGSTTKYENPVFIMAGGFGTRLRPLTDNCPKPMLQVGSKPILEIVLKGFANAGFVNFYISTHYLPEMIKDFFGDGSRWNVKITYVHEETPLGTGGALGLLPDNLPDLPIFLINGDILTNVDFETVLEFHNHNNSLATMCVRDYEYKVPFGVINGKNNQIISMVEKPSYRYSVNTGIYVISAELRKLVKMNQSIDMPSLLEQAIESGGKVMMCPIHDYWLDIGRLDDYQKAQTDVVNLGLLDD